MCVFFNGRSLRRHGAPANPVGGFGLCARSQEPDPLLGDELVDIFVKANFTWKTSEGLAVPIKNGSHIVEASAVWMASILKWERNSSGTATAFFPPSPYMNFKI